MASDRKSVDGKTSDSLGFSAPARFHRSAETRSMAKSSAKRSTAVRAAAAKKDSPPPPKVVSLEERTAALERRLQAADADFQRQYKENLDMSWIYHDTAIEGVVYTVQELRAAIDPSFQAEVDSSLQPVVEEIRRHREALDFIRDQAVRR